MSSTLKIISASLVLLASQAASAAVIYDNGAPDNVNLGGVFANNNQAAADDFTLTSAANISSATFFTFEELDGVQGNSPWDNGGSWLILGENLTDPTRPGSLVAAGAFGSAVQTGLAYAAGSQDTFQHFRYDFDLGPVVNLAAGNYWFGIYAQADDTTGHRDIFWQTTSTSVGASPALAAANSDVNDPANWSATTVNDLAFILHDNSVPVPAPVFLMLASLFALRRMKSK